ncbi:hypothetical protein AAFF_G00351450 [Aldrovandia affinis]|uniref:Zinc finger CCCH domain-containing protein 15 n=1 Tax=Aldrovandia affinis TaxID=143900 RepID=A0AAD7SIZ4_9TELE|nr:hypothetical protein AAFF_G00351450 [Aldrovandia affinis]
MPPKKPAPAVAGSKKTQEKKKEKIIEDKTFGLKNKKGAKQQKFIKTVTHQVKHGQQNARQLAAAEGKKTDKKKELSELNELFKPVVAAQKVSKGVDPKSVLCAFFKQGHCTKDTMETWDEKKLEEVINKKHGEAEKKKAKTQIVCRYFLDAIEINKYGWFWVCPGGGDNCMYRHALPAGFVLKKDKKKEDMDDEGISMEELIENERSALGPNVTRITLETFLAWKKRKRQEKIQKAEEDMERKREDFQAGRSIGVSGREVFEFRPDLVDEDDEEADDTRYSNDAMMMMMMMTTTMRMEAWRNMRTLTWPEKETDDSKLCEASGGVENGLEDEQDEQDEVTEAVPVDENLFTGEDLDELEEELNTLDLEE